MLPSISFSHLTQKMLENIVKRSEFVYTREQHYTKVIYYCNIESKLYRIDRQMYDWF